jgi:hypothetical protein
MTLEERFPGLCAGWNGGYTIAVNRFSIRDPGYWNP